MIKQIKETTLTQIVANYEKKIGHSFKPNKDTYIITGINRKRFGMLLKNKNVIPIKVIEIESLSKFFKVPISDFFQDNQ